MGLQNHPYPAQGGNGFAQAQALNKPMSNSFNKDVKCYRVLLLDQLVCNNKHKYNDIIINEILNFKSWPKSGPLMGLSYNSDYIDINAKPGIIEPH